MQSDVEFDDESVIGTLHHLDGSGWTSGTWPLDETAGHFFAFKVDVGEAEDVEVTAELVGGAHGPVTLDSDMNAVVRVTDEATQKLKITASADGMETTVKLYDLSGLTLEPEMEPEP